MTTYTGYAFESAKGSQSALSKSVSAEHPLITRMLLTLPKGLAAEKETCAWIVSPSKPAMQQPPPAICTAPVNATAAVVEVSNGVIAVGVSEAIGVVNGLDPSVGEIGVGVRVVVGGTRVATAVGLAA